MKYRIGCFVLMVTLASPAIVHAAPHSAKSAAFSPRSTQSFDQDWLFLLGDPAGAEQSSYRDSDWRTLSVPHDWSIAGPFDEANPTGAAGAFLPAGVGWYRKHFVLPRSAAHRRVFIEFEGVMANSDVWVNGVHLGERPYGYVSFRYELTGHLRFGSGSPNVIAVRCDDSKQPASRWAPGAGIYRHVLLIETGDVHVQGWGTFVSTPTIAQDHATVKVASTIVNESPHERRVALRIAIYDPDGRLVRRVNTAMQSLAPNGSATLSADIPVPHPQLWDIGHGVLYRAVVDVLSEGKDVDREAVPFGIREFHFDAATGFWLNGRNLKIKGACLHAEDGGFGAAVPLDAWEHRLLALRRLGVNAIRTAHNPPSPEFLDLCDRLGFLVMDEMFDCWTVGKTPYDYHLYFLKWYKTDTRDTVLRDRNHPSIILWSAGNEIHDTPHAALAIGILRSMVDIFHAYDPTRPVTMALFRPNASHDYEDGLADLLDVVGQNYRENELLAAHAQKPSRKILGTENTHDRKAWLAMRDNPPYAGQFLWSGADYLGEAHVWPYIANGSGLLDRTDFPHPRGLERQSWWSEAPMVRIVRRVAPSEKAPIDPGEATDPKRPRELLFADWTPDDLAPHTEDVEVYSNAAHVELFLNGRSLGSQALHQDASPRIWQVAFAPGSLRAVATDPSGKEVATDELRTAGKAARIVLSADHPQIAPGWEHVDYVTATVVDANGIVVPRASELITFHLQGPGLVTMVDNGDNTSHESFQGNARRAYEGRCIAVLQASQPGNLTLSASAVGLAGSTVHLTAEP